MSGEPRRGVPRTAPAGTRGTLPRGRADMLRRGAERTVLRDTADMRRQARAARQTRAAATRPSGSAAGNPGGAGSAVRASAVRAILCPMSAPGAWSTAEGAASWQASVAQRQQSLAAATELLFAWAGIVPGMRILEVVSGTGDLALLA